VPAPARPPAPGEEAPRIVRIEFAGNALYAADTMKVMMKLKEGGRLDRAALDADAAMLYRYFRDVKIEQVPVEGGIVLRLTVSENPLVKELVINGLEEIKREEIDKLPIRTKVGLPLFPRDQELDREDIIAAYRRKGFHFADVSVAPPVDLPGGSRVVFTVIEGPKVSVDAVQITGNTAIPRNKILEVMLTKKGWFLDQKLFVEEELRADLVEIRKLYRSQGYLDAEAVIDALTFSDDRSAVIITVAIDEGPQYTVGKITFEQVTGEPGTSDDRRDPSGPGAMPPDDVAWFYPANLQGWLGLVPGQVYDGKEEAKGRDRIREEYYKRSYLDARLDPAELRPRAGGHVVDVRLRIVEGRKQRVAAVTIVGNEFTRDKVIRREIRQQPGGYVDRNELDRGLARARELGYFERVSRRVEDVLGPDDRPVGDLKEAVYEVVEAKTGKLTLGVAVSTDGGLGASASYQKRNFDIARPPTCWDDVKSGRAWTGAGQTFNLTLAPSTVNSRFGFEFIEPHLFDTNLGVAFSAAKRISYRETYTEDALGYQIRLMHPLLQAYDDCRSLNASLAWRHERLDITDIDDDSVPGVFLFAGEAEIRSLALTLSLRTYDDRARPNHRTGTSLSFEYAGGALGGDIDYWKAHLSHESWWKVREDEEGRRSSIRLNLDLGVSEAFDDTPEVPPYERFYAGGRGTLRGFAYRGVGPHASGHPMGGEFLLAGSLEYEFPLLGETVSGVVFTDAGTLGTSLHEDDAFLMRWSVGAGLRIKIPALGNAPLALDFAFPILKEGEDDTQVISFSLAREF
jgi:outer membrane protein insertion porin family